MQRRLDSFSDTGLNFRPGTLSEAAGYSVVDVRHALPAEAPGEPASGASFAIARRLIADYEFTDPSIVRAYFDPQAALTGRTMVLHLQALGVFHLDVGVRILRVIDDLREVDGRPVRVWGWTYGTLRGHVEQGEMSWEVWKWLDSGDVDFRVHAISRPARIRNPIIGLGFRIVGPHERKTFLHGTGERMNQRIRRELDGSASG